MDSYTSSEARTRTKCVTRIINSLILELGQTKGNGYEL